MATLDTLVKKTSRDYEIEVKYPSFAINRTRKVIPKEPSIESNDPPIVKYTKHALQRTSSEKFENKEKTSDKYELKTPQKPLKKAKPGMVKQDSKENKRDWLKKQLSVNHHYLKDLKMPLNSISHRNAMLNIKRYRLKASSCPDIFKNSMITIDEKEEVRDWLL